ncbi:MAG: hypothetical protein IPM12_16055 [Flavobacteriales bacterium]|nr:hypothetical protein [Flavobacteriales bacterium]
MNSQVNLLGPALMSAMAGLACLNGHGQQRNAHWLFWRNHLEFASGNAVANASNSIDRYACISDTAGQLKAFVGYTAAAGYNVFNANGDMIPGQSMDLFISGTGAGRVNALFIPVPGLPDGAFLAYLDRVLGTSPTIYRAGLVRMDLGPPGQLPSSMEPETQWVTEDVARWIFCTPHANGEDYWMVTQPLGGNAFHAFRISGGGAEAVPSVSNAGPIRPSTRNHGLAVPSEDGSVIAISMRPSNSNDYAIDTLNLDLYTFDSAQGVLSYWLNLPSPRVEGLEFSPSGRFLYVLEHTFLQGIGVHETLVQYDLQAGDVAGSRSVVHDYIQGPTFDLTRRQQLAAAIDGRVYRIRNNRSDTLGVIMAPDLAAPLCNYVHDSFICADVVGSLPNPLKRYHDSPNIITSAPSAASAPMRIAPLPLDLSGWLSHADLNGPLKLAWLDAAGRMVRSEAVLAEGGRAPLNSAGLASGSYMLQVSGAGLRAPMSVKVLVAR